MLNTKLVSKIFGSLLLIEALLMSCSLGVALYYGGSDVMPFTWSVVVLIAAGVAFRLLGLKASNALSRRDAYFVVTTVWVLFTIFGMMPFLIGGYLHSVTDAFFETISGFTTTGATIIDYPERLPRGLLFWRSITQWIGGLGIVFFTIAILPSFVGGSTRVFAAEATGPIVTKLHPKLSTGAKWIWAVYAVLTISCFLSYKLCGMSWFDAINYAFTSTATGGFATESGSIATFRSPAEEYVCTLFCFLSGVNFTMLYAAVARFRIKQLFRNNEFRFYLFVVTSCTLFVMVELMWHNHYDLERAFRSGVFQVVSFITTTGLFSDDASKWPHVTWFALILCMVVGGCSGSTSGGMKSIRAVMILKIIRNEFRQILHPNAVLPLNVDGHNVPQSKRVTLLAFVGLYLILAFLLGFAMMACGVDSTNSFTIAISSMGNVGPTLGLEIGPTMSWAQLPDVAKWICAFLMLVGRLELFTVLVLFTKAFWKDN